MARFYTPFEVAVLLFLIALDQAYFEARPGRRYLPHAALLLAALVHDLTLLLTPLLFLPLLPGCTRLRLEGRTAGSGSRWPRSWSRSASRR